MNSESKQQTQTQSSDIIHISYAKAPKTHQELRSNDSVVSLTTNLLKLEISKSEQKLCIYSVSVTPELQETIIHYSQKFKDK